LCNFAFLFPLFFFFFFFLFFLLFLKNTLSHQMRSSKVLPQTPPSSDDEEQPITDFRMEAKDVHKLLVVLQRGVVTAATLKPLARRLERLEREAPRTDAVLGSYISMAKDQLASAREAEVEVQPERVVVVEDIVEKSKSPVQEDLIDTFLSELEDHIAPSVSNNADSSSTNNSSIDEGAIDSFMKGLDEKEREERKKQAVAASLQQWKREAEEKRRAVEERARAAHEAEQKKAALHREAEAIAARSNKEIKFGHALQRAASPSPAREVAPTLRLPPSPRPGDKSPRTDKSPREQQPKDKTKTVFVSHGFN
jgi:hypothetical protein